MYLFLIALCIMAIIVLMINIGVVSKKDVPLMKWVCIILFAFSILRYLTLIVYGNHPTLSQLEVLKPFYFATSIGLTIPMASSIWFISPYLREKLTYLKYLLCFIPWIIFYLVLIITVPAQIQPGQNMGYTLELTGQFPMYLSIAQGSFVAIMIILCAIGFFKYKNEYLRSAYMLIIGACILLTIDGLGYFISLLNLIPPFTVTEICGFFSILYAFSLKPIKAMKYK